MRKKIASLVVIGMVVSLIISPPVFALEQHEDAGIAEPVFGGISLFNYYSGSLDFVLQRNPVMVEGRLEKMPFANIPEELETATDVFRTSGIEVSRLVVDVYEGNLKLRTLIKEFLLKEAITQANWVYARISEARSELDQLEGSAVATGQYFKVASPAAGSDLKSSYNEVLEKIDRIREMLDLYEEILASSPVTAELLSPTGSPIWSPTGSPIQLELLKSTDITLSVEPLSAYVGEDIHFAGLLTSENKPLAGREVSITLNGQTHTVVKTDSYGHYDGILRVPYWYIPELDVQAIYYPKDEDIGLYTASLSPVVKVEVLFYKAELEVKVDEKAYPGLKATVTGRFDYGQSPFLKDRYVEIYLDDVLITRIKAQETFTQNIGIGPQTEVGKHNITVSAAASGRYAPAVGSTVLNVIRATPILDIDVPKVAMIPGSIGLEGKLYSEIGPLNGASVKMGLGKSQFEAVSSEGGALKADIKAGWDFSIVGSQNLTIAVSPQEPWNAPLASTRTIVVVNVINCSGILIILVLLGIYLPGRLRRKLGDYSRRRVKPAARKTLPGPSPAYSAAVIVPPSMESDKGNSGSREDTGEPRTIIFYLYRLVARLVQKIAKALLRPQQTLREFAKENSKVLGPAAGYFVELTRMAERLLYSPYEPTQEDVVKSKQLSRTIEEEAKGEIV